MDNLEAEIALEWVEVMIAMKQRVSLIQAECRYDAVDCLSYGHAAGAELTVIVR